MKLLQDKVLVKLNSRNPQTNVNGIIVNEDEKDENGYYMGEVLIVGEGKYQHGVLTKPTVKIGDKILYSFKQDIIYNGKKYHLISNDNILAIL